MHKNQQIHDQSIITNNKIKKSKFKFSNTYKTTANASDLIPVYIKEILPNDHFNIKTNVVVRQNTLIKPVMDNSQIDIMYFFVPNRTIMDDWKKLMGENTDGFGAVTNPPTIPQVTAPEGGWDDGTIADYFGIPTKISGLSISALPFRAYTYIWNEWFRDQNLQQPSHINRGNTETKGTNGTNQTIDLECGGYPAKSNKKHDYFTSALPYAQKGEPIAIKLTEGKIKTGPTYELEKEAWPIQFSIIPGTGEFKSGNRNMILTGSGTKTKTVSTNGEASGNDEIIYAPSNLYTNSESITINELRNAITLQQMLELDARGGTRYTEYINSHFGIHSGDARQQRPEYLGGISKPIDVNQVTQTSQSTTGDNGSPQANLSAWGYQKIIGHQSVNKTFTEHGFIIGVATIRYDHSYSQGIEPLWTRKTKYDHYDPIFANIGEQPIKNKEIYASGISNIDDETFGFKEPWGEYRNAKNMITGKMKVDLNSWNYGDRYNDLPKLSDTWIRETATNIDRSLAIKSETEPQYNIDIYFDVTAERPMPTYSRPGLNKI